MATYYAEAADGRSTFFRSRAETPAGIVRAACRALGVDYAAAAWHLAAEVVDGLRAVGLTASQAEACTVAHGEGLEIWGTVRLNLAYVQDAAAALKSVFGKKAWALVDSSHGPCSAATVTAGNGDALASVVVMPVNVPETRDASAAFIEGR